MVTASAFEARQTEPFALEQTKWFCTYIRSPGYDAPYFTAFYRSGKVGTRSWHAVCERPGQCQAKIRRRCFFSFGRPPAHVIPKI